MKHIGHRVSLSSRSCWFQGAVSTTVSVVVTKVAITKVVATKVVATKVVVTKVARQRSLVTKIAGKAS